MGWGVGVGARGEGWGQRGALLDQEVIDVGEGGMRQVGERLGEGGEGWGEEVDVGWGNGERGGEKGVRGEANVVRQVGVG